uniref:Uncharacterized protein n=1 Tax=Panagrolaimus superbus TaxID=310955 RepID=A0A914Z1U6_9BILA
MGKPNKPKASSSKDHGPSSSANRLNSVVVKPKLTENKVRAFIKTNRKDFLAAKDELNHLRERLPARLQETSSLCNHLAEQVSKGFSVSASQVYEMEQAFRKLKEYASMFELKERLSREGFEARNKLDEVIATEDRRMEATRGSSGGRSATRGSGSYVRDSTQGRGRNNDEDKENSGHRHPRIYY